jgi:hypothetical protein
LKKTVQSGNGRKLAQSGLPDCNGQRPKNLETFKSTMIFVFVDVDVVVVVVFVVGVGVGVVVVDVDVVVVVFVVLSNFFLSLTQQNGNGTFFL